MGLADYVGGLWTGFQLAAGGMVFAVALTVLLGRWVTAEQNWMGVCLRGGILVALFVLALRTFGTIWYWMMVALAPIPLLEMRWGEGSTTLWLRGSRYRRLAEATAAAAEQAQNAMARMRLARALLETDQIEAGLAALDEAVALAPDDSKDVLEDMAREAKEEFVQYCPSCGHPNRAAASACGRCLGPVKEGRALRALLWLVRLVLRRPRPEM